MTHRIVLWKFSWWMPGAGTLFRTNLKCQIIPLPQMASSTRASLTTKVLAVPRRCGSRRKMASVPWQVQRSAWEATLRIAIDRRFLKFKEWWIPERMNEIGNLRAHCLIFQLLTIIPSYAESLKRAALGRRPVCKTLLTWTICSPWTCETNSSKDSRTSIDKKRKKNLPFSWTLWCLTWTMRALDSTRLRIVYSVVQPC